MTRVATALARLALPGAGLVVALFLAAPTAALAAGPPQIGAAWTTEVTSASATLRGEVNPEGEATTCRFEYVTEAHFLAEGFTAASPAPCENSPGSGTSYVGVFKHVSALRSATTYRYRLVAVNTSSEEASLDTNPAGAPLLFTTQRVGAAFSLPDSRAWELVSPLEKNGGAIQGPEGNHGGGVLQAAAQGNSITYSSSSSFGEAPEGAPPASQYISTRTASSWATENITTPIVSGSYGNDPNGVPYQLFSTDLARGLMLNGVHCRGEGTGCPVDNPPLPGSGAPEGFQDYYLRNDETRAFTALLSEANKGPLSLSASEFDLTLAGASPDLGHVVLSTCAKLTADATQQPACESGGPNLYEWSGGQLRLINKLGGDSTGTSDAHLAAPASAISTNGQRVYFTLGEQAALYLREGEPGAKLVAEGSSFQTASADGSIAFYTKEEGGSGRHLYRYEAIGEHTSDLTASGGVTGVLGASSDGQTVYFQDASGLERWHEGSTTQVAAGAAAAQPSDWPPTTGTARLSASGEELLFLSKESLTRYDNHDQTTGQPDSEVFLYEAGGGGTLRCLSCNPTGERPLGPSTVPGAYANGTEAGLFPGQLLTDSYKPRALSAGGRRVFFDSGDALAALDTNHASDAYQWEAQGEGGCAAAGGCTSLISSGTDPAGASFVDASESGADAYFLTFASLRDPEGSAITPQGNVDPGSADVYDARVGGGFPPPKEEIECEGDGCARLEEPPEDPALGTAVPGPTNPPLEFPKPARKCPKGTKRVVKHGKVRCVRKHKKRRHR